MQEDEARWLPSYYEMHGDADRTQDINTNLDSDAKTVSAEKSVNQIQRSVDCAPLLNSAHLRMYRENAFRVTGLSIDATKKEAKRRSDELKMMQEAGHVHGSNSAAFALDPPPSVDDIREAMQRLEEPEQRLIDEFFWFWPTNLGESANDPAIQAIFSGDSSKAYEIWASGEDDPVTGFIATHNMAIMFHLIALDWTIYHIAAEIDADREEKIKNYWKESLHRWEKVVSDDRIWDTLKNRIRNADDARLTTGFARRMSDTLPDALDKINAEAALQFAEQQRLDWATIHIAFMNESHQGLDNVEKTAALVLTPTRNRVLQHITTAKEQAAVNPGGAHEIAEKLLDHAEPLEELFELFHGKDSHHKTELFDEVASTANEIIVVYRNKASGDANVALPLYRRALQLATSIDIRQQIQKNITFGSNVIKGATLQPVYDRLKIIQDSKASAKSRFNDAKLLIAELAKLAEKEGAESELYTDLADTMAIVLRSIAITANNDEKDPNTSQEAIALAKKLAKDRQLIERIDSDLATVRNNNSAAQVVARQKQRENSGCIAIVVCIVIGMIIGLATGGSDGWLGGGILGLIAGGLISRFIKALS